MQERVKRRLASIYASLGDYDALSSVAKPGGLQPWMQSSDFRQQFSHAYMARATCLLWDTLHAVFEEEASWLVPMPQLQNAHNT